MTLGWGTMHVPVLLSYRMRGVQLKVFWGGLTDALHASHDQGLLS